MGDDIRTQIPSFGSQADQCSAAALDCVAFDAIEGLDHAGLGRIGGLDLDRVIVRAVENQKVDFVESRVAVVVEIRLFTVVNPTLEKFHDDEVLKETAVVVDLAQSFR